MAGANPRHDRARRDERGPGLPALCDTTATVICYQDTARVATVGASDYPLANWLWFAATGDSIEISVNPPATIVTSLGEERDSLQNTARYFRHRFSRNGVVEIFLALEQGYGDTVPYVLSITRSRIASNNVLRPTGLAATLTVETRRTRDAFSIVPISVAAGVRDRLEWRIHAKAYKVALVSDSLYELCRLPCSKPDTVKLTPFTNVVKRF